MCTVFITFAALTPLLMAEGGISKTCFVKLVLSIILECFSVGFRK